MGDNAKLPINMWFPKTRMAVVRWLSDWWLPSQYGVSLEYFFYVKPKNRTEIWYGFGTDWKGIISFICAKLFYRRKGDWWKTHSVIVDLDTNKYYHLTDKGAESGDDINALCFYPLDYRRIDYTPSVSTIERRHKAVVDLGIRVVWKDAFLWALGLKDDVFLCHHYVLTLLSRKNDSHKETSKEI